MYQISSIQIVLFYLFTSKTLLQCSGNENHNNSLTSEAPHEMCPSRSSPLYHIQWPSTKDITPSKPLCVDAKKELVYRKCLDGEWSFEPPCAKIQPESLPQCPEGFTEHGDICYTRTPKGKFLPDCPFADVLPFVTYKDFITDRIWMPVTRNFTDGVDLLQWIEASDTYKLYFNGSYIITDSAKDKNCLVYGNGTMELVSCTDYHPRICAYQKLTKLDTDLCTSLGNCHQSDYTSKSSCFCLQQNYYGNSSLAEFLKFYQNNIYTNLTYSNCSIGLRKTREDKYVWVNSQVETEYTYWSSAATFGESYIYGASTQSGWILTKELNPCFVSEQSLHVQEPRLYLELVNNSFILTMRNQAWLKEVNHGYKVLCFTNANPETPHVRVYTLQLPIHNATDIFYKIDPISSAPGHYWCEAFGYLDLNIIKSEVLLFRNSEYLDFVAIFRFKSSIVLLDLNSLTQIRSEFFAVYNTIDYLKQNYTPRIMKIESLDEVNNWIWINIHLTMMYPVPGTVNEEDNYHHVKQLLTATFIDDITLETFSHLDYCEPEIDFLTWPKTLINQEAFPKEFCFTIDATLVSRICEGDFINGAKWCGFKHCKKLSESDTTPELLSFYYANTSTIKQLREVVMDHTPNDFAVLDVFLVASICQHVNRSSLDEITAFSEIVNHMLNFNSEVLFGAQMVTNAIRMIINTVGDILQNYPGELQIVKSHFAMIRNSSKNLSGIVLRYIDGRCIVDTIPGNYTEDDVQEIKDMQSAIWLSPEFRAQNDQTGLSVFLNDAFFPQNIQIFSHVNYIFGVHLPLDFALGSVKTIHRTDDPNIYCLFWSEMFTWIPWDKNAGKFVVCDFMNADGNYFTVDNIYSSTNVTADLVNILYSSAMDEYDSLENLAKISNRFEEFVAIDVSLTAQILEQSSGFQGIELANLATTVNNLQKIDKNILRESQIDFGATDQILQNVDAILQNILQEDETVISNDSFVVFVSNLQNVTGLGLIDSNQTMIAEVIRDFNVTNDYDTLVMLSASLIDQLGPEAKVIITVFFNDALFNEKHLTKTPASKIIGVVLPDVGNYSGPVSIYHKLRSADHFCAYWNYLDQNETGRWDHEGVATSTSSLVGCDYWHTTHFGLFLLDGPKYTDIYGILDMITTINLGISLASLGCIILTAFFFEKWRKNLGNQILLNFTIAILIQIVTFYASRHQRHYRNFIGCTIIGSVLHYSIISQFCWMFIIALLQFRRFVLVFGKTPKRLLLKACFCGWIIPLLPVIIVLSIDNDNYMQNKGGFCYPSGWGLYAGVWLPVLSIGIFNFIVFIHIMYTVLSRNVESCHIAPNDSKYHWRLSVLLFFLLGLTWVFGLLAQLGFGITFVYIFDITGTLQGLILFLYFIVFNANTRAMYIHAIKRYCNKKR